jgi:hypothetical protein
MKKRESGDNKEIFFYLMDGMDRSVNRETKMKYMREGGIQKKEGWKEEERLKMGAEEEEEAERKKEKEGRQEREKDEVNKSGVCSYVT